jgi:DNA-binding NarL/FixJ family response regulator
LQPDLHHPTKQQLDHSLARLAHQLPDLQTFKNDASVLNLKLSHHQKELLLLLNAGLSNREVAAQPNVSEHTVKVPLWRFLKKIKSHQHNASALLGATEWVDFKPS